MSRSTRSKLLNSYGILRAMENVSRAADRIIRTGFGLLFILVPLILTPWNYELFEYNKMMVTYGLTAIILGAWAINMIVKGEIRIKRTPLDIPIFLFVLSQLISTLFSMDPHVSWFGYYSRFNGGMFSVITYVALYYAFVSNFLTQSEHTIFRSPSSVLRLLQAMLVTGLVVSLYGIAEHFGIDKNLWVQDVQNRVFSTLGQPNWLAAYLIALIPISMGLGLQCQMPNAKFQINEKNNKKIVNNYLSTIYHLSFIIWHFLAIILFLTLLWTRSRSGFMALAIADIVFWGLVFTGLHPEKAENKGATLKKLYHPFLLIHASFFLIITINGTYIPQIDNWVTVKAWQQRFAKFQVSSFKFQVSPSGSPSSSLAPVATSSAPLIGSGVTDSGDIRKYVWEGAINIWRSSPKAFFIGTGTETYAFAFYQYKPIGHNLTSEWDFLYNKAHNEYLNFLATTGLLGLGTYLLLIGSFIFWFIKSQISNLKFQRNYKSQMKPQTGNSKPIPDEVGTIENLKLKIENLRVALFAGWISILITNFFGFSVVIMQLFFYLFPALIFVLSSPAFSQKTTSEEGEYVTASMKWHEKTKKILGVSIALISILLVCMIIISWFADKQFASGYHYSRAGYLPQAYQALSTAINLNPTEPFYHDEQGNVLATLAVASWKDNQATVSQELAQMSVRENDFALSVSPKNVNFWKSRTKIFYALSTMDPNLLKDAIKALEYAITLSPSDPKLYYNAAILYGQTEETTKAVDFMKKSIELKPNYREGYFGLSLLYTELKMPEESKQIVTEYLEKVDPNDKEFQELIQ